MNLSLDYDGTYTRDPALWDAVIKAFRMRGHKVFVITMRYESQGAYVKEDLQGKVDKIYFTGHKAKQKFILEKGINIDVWIDDMPFFIYMDAKDNDPNHDGTTRPSDS